MKDRKIFLALLLLLSLAGCNTSGKKAGAVMEAYHAVLLNEKTFYSVNDQKDYTLNEYDVWRAERFAVIDMDGDGIPEVVLELTTGGEGAFEVLHYEEGKVYGFHFPFRGMLDLSADGTYFASGGASDGFFYQAATIKKDVYEKKILAHSLSGLDANGDRNMSCYISDAKVTEEEYDAFSTKMWEKMQKNPAVWHDFTNANIASVFPSDKSVNKVQEEPLTKEPENNPEKEQENLLPKLLANHTKVASFKYFMAHDGQLYIQFAAQNALEKNDWRNAVGFRGFTIIGNSLFYVQPNGNYGYKVALYRTDLQGDNETEIDADVSLNDIYVVGNKIIYANQTEITEEEYTCKGIYCYDVTSSKTTLLMNEKRSDDIGYFRPVSFDDDFVYYQSFSANDDICRIRWDGTDEERLFSVFWPEGLFQVDGHYYYCVSPTWDNSDYDSAETTVTGYSVQTGNKKAEYTVNAAGLIALKDGWAFFGNKNGIFKLDLDDGRTMKMANFAPNEKVNDPGVFGNCIIGNALYFTVADYDEYVTRFRLYKVPLNGGGEMEYQGVEWSFVAI